MGVLLLYRKYFVLKRIKHTLSWGKKRLPASVINNTNLQLQIIQEKIKKQQFGMEVNLIIVQLLLLCGVCWGLKQKWLEDRWGEGRGRGRGSRDLLQEQGESAMDPTCPATFWEGVEPECYGNDKRDFKIFQGTKTDPGRFPYLASLQMPSRSQPGCYYHQCGATFIAQDLVLTAAHCIYSEAHDWRNNVMRDDTSGDLRVPLMVAVSPACRNQRGGGRFMVLRYWISPEYRINGAGGDIAILQIEEPANLSRVVELEPAEDQSLFREQLMTIVGWGDVSPEEGDFEVKAMRYGNLRFIEEYECETMLRAAGTRLKFDSEREFCAFDPTTDSCEGDSGGPILVTDFTNAGSGEDVRDVQVGVISWGPKSACSSPDKQYAGVYTRVDVNLDWILGIIEESKTTVSRAQEFIEMPCIDTQANCTCEESWYFKQALYHGCYNPDGDEGGDWCVVKAGSCQQKPSGQLVSRSGPIGLYFDYCQPQCYSNARTSQDFQSMMGGAETVSVPDPCMVTRAGCICENQWSYSSVQHVGCSNPDGDVRGNWCKFVAGTCSLVPGGRDWDYCKKEC
eukprot:TRINITY_DN5290_c0_g2_i2.p1 TRINITY_DN5290_c0_g2~~TRINITY_DN5290_c0_g2_i2.p1  ORF type:complete len:566 (-),score=79.65 TRINITY_DN5290_c0_g2_i2:847-2544(-)